jgi:anti-anti-sigma factor
VKNACVIALPESFGPELEDSFDAAVSRALESTPQVVVVDSSKLRVTNSAGIGLLIDLVRRAQEQEVRVALAGLSGQPKLVIERVGLPRHAPLFDSVEEAMASQPNTDRGHPSE